MDRFVPPRFVLLLIAGLLLVISIEGAEPLSGSSYSAGASSEQPSETAVPEPSTYLLLAAALAFGSAKRKKQRTGKSF